MKNSEVVANAQKVLELAKKQGFDNATLQFIDEDDNVYESVADAASNFTADDEVELTVNVNLTLSLTMVMVGDPEDEDAEPEATFP
jgi:hypothetical protein